MPSFKPLALALLLFPMRVQAQDSATTQFRHGQWGLQLSGNFNLLSLGIMRFTGPRSAWLLTFDAAGSFTRNKRVDTGGTTTTSNAHGVGVSAGIGKRVYQAPRNEVRSFQSIGVTAGFSDQRLGIGGATVKSNTWNTGLMGQVGGAYWVTPSLSIGGTASATAGYTHAVLSDLTGKTTQQGFVISGVDAFFAIGLYF